jgi:hypothetical protein
MESRRAFAAFTTASVGRLLEFRFAGDAVDTVVLHSPIIGGRIQLVGTLSDNSAAEMVRKFSSADATLEVRVIDEKRWFRKIRRRRLSKWRRR